MWYDFEATQTTTVPSPTETSDAPHSPRAVEGECGIGTPPALGTPHPEAKQAEDLAALAMWEARSSRSRSERTPRTAGEVRRHRKHVSCVLTLPSWTDRKKPGNVDGWGERTPDKTKTLPLILHGWDLLYPGMFTASTFWTSDDTSYLWHCFPCELKLDCFLVEFQSESDTRHPTVERGARRYRKLPKLRGPSWIGVAVAVAMTMPL